MPSQTLAFASSFPIAMGSPQRLRYPVSGRLPQGMADDRAAGLPTWRHSPTELDDGDALMRRRLPGWNQDTRYLLGMRHRWRPHITGASVRRP